MSIFSSILKKNGKSKPINKSGFSFYGISYYGYYWYAMTNKDKLKLLNLPNKCTHDEALGYHLLNTFAEVFERRQQNEIDDQQWQSWKNWISLACQHKSMIKIWNDAELQNYFDPLFHRFMNTEVFPLLINQKL
jgi:hypothetical protein